MSFNIYDSSDDEEILMDLEQFAEMQSRKDSNKNSTKRPHNIAFIDSDSETTSKHKASKRASSIPIHSALK